MAQAELQVITIRGGTRDDNQAAYRVLYLAVNDLARRIGADPIPGEMETSYARGEQLFRHLADTAAEFWVAENAEGVVGYARSIEHAGFFELTEFFVLPEHQSAGIGRRLLERAFPEDRGEIRVIVATTDVRALGSYAKAGMTARTVIASLIGQPPSPNASIAASLAVERVAPGDGALAELTTLDRRIAGFDHGSTIAWLAETREALLFRRDGRAMGYAFVAKGGVGPIGAQEPDALPAILDEVLRRTAALGAETVSFEVPMSNGVALRHLLVRGLTIDPFFTLLLSNREFGQMDRYLAFSPPIFL
jgi:ribosomal protein S18 acetylase RimI-like enzyme